MEFKSFYKSIDGRKFNTWCNYTKRLDSYGCGCQHDCEYCYSKSLLSFRGLWDPLIPSISNIYKIKNRIKKLSTNEVIKLGGMTDCFQPLEMKEKATYRTIQILNQFRINYLIVTKSDLVSNDEYMSIYDKNLAHFQITITSTDEKINYEKAPPFSKRIETINKLYKQGYDVSLRLSPFIEENINIDKLGLINCDKILIEFLKVNHWVKKWFNIDYSEYSLKYGGYSHLNLDKKIGLVNKINGFSQVSVGEYVEPHYKYFKENVNYNKNDCCNLNFTPRGINKQLTLFNGTKDTI